MSNFKLSPHFTFYELTTTNHRSLLEENRKVSHDLMMNGYALAASILEPIRCHYDKPLIVHSGYRCPALNSKIGGSKTSQHQSFQAADFHVIGEDLQDVFQWIWKESGLRWGQLISEGIVQNKPTWIHISLGDPWWSKRVQQVLTWDSSRGYVRLQ